MNDPYKILGISRNATEEEIKKAYREMARKYHPDNYANSPLADLAQEKMKEINEAYDSVMHERQSGGSGTADDYDFGFSGGTGRTGSTSYGTGKFDYIREMINRRNFSEAEIRLDACGSEDRDAEWYYLKGCVFMGRGWYFEASKHFRRACEMAPNNPEYKAAYESISNMASDYDRRGSVDRDSVCDICTGLLCADCCCEAMGGDLISCC